MDPFTADGELVNIHTAFIQSQHHTVLSDFQPTDFSASNALPVEVLQYRSQLALGQFSEVLSALASSAHKNTPDLAAVKLYAQFLASSPQNTLNEAAVDTLVEKAGDNLTVQLLCGTILARTQKQEQALSLLAKHQGSLDAVALTIQILLAQNRTSAAAKEAATARSFAQDALLVNLAESWIGMRRGGESEYQKAFYVFEELAQSPASTSVSALVAQAVSELHMGRVEEAEAALERAGEMEGGKEDVGVLVNRVVLDTTLGREVNGTAVRGLELEVELEGKREEFRRASGKYSPKFE